MTELAQVGAFCPHPDCPDYGHTGQGNLIRFGYTRQGRQRFRCKSCGKTFNENYGTLFYGKQTSEEAILETLALLAEGTRISSLARVKGFKEDTILSWLRQAATHAEAVEQALMARYALGPSQLDGLWSYVGHKGVKKANRKPRKRAPSGGQP